MVELKAVGATLGPKVCREVFGCKQASRDPLARRQDALDPDKTKRRLDCRDYFCRADRKIQFNLQPRDGLRKGKNFLGTFHIRKKYDVWACGHDTTQILNAIIGKTIDTHGTHDTLSPAALHQHRDAWSGSRTIGRRGELFKVCNHDIGSAGECCFLCLKVQSGGEQPTAAQRHGSAQRCKGTH